MRIALVSQEYPPETARGGIGSQTYAKAKGLTALGHEVYVISRSTNSYRIQKEVDGVHVIRIPGMEQQIPEMTEIVEWLTHSTVVAVEIEKLHSESPFDLIDFPEWAAEAYVYLLNRTKWKRIPAVVQLHGPLVMLAHTLNWPDKESIFYKVGTQMEATCVQLADAVYSSSNCSAQWIRDHYQTTTDDIPVLHLGIDTKVFAPQDLPKYERPTIVFAGKLVQNKGVEELVDAAIYLAKEIDGLQLRLLGRGDENMVRKLKAKKGALGVLHFEGFVSNDLLPEELSKAHVFAAPSYYEGGPGFVYLEAMACGLPVIGCSGSGIEEIIEDGENGFLVPPRNVDALIYTLRKLFSDKHQLNIMGEKARAFAVRNADTNTCVRTLETFYYSVVQQMKMAKL